MSCPTPTRVTLFWPTRTVPLDQSNCGDSESSFAWQWTNQGPGVWICVHISHLPSRSGRSLFTKDSHRSLSGLAMLGWSFQGGAEDWSCLAVKAASFQGCLALVFVPCLCCFHSPALLYRYLCWRVSFFTVPQTQIGSSCWPMTISWHSLEPIVGLWSDDQIWGRPETNLSEAWTTPCAPVIFPEAPEGLG